MNKNLEDSYFKPQKIAVLLSGGVDSSVVLALLQQLREQGHSVTAFYLKIWLQDEFIGLGECPWEEDLAFANQVCEQFQISLTVLSLQKEYWELVVTHSINEIRLGHTPNPDMYCNSKIKFGVFIQYIEGEYDVIASGHYASLVRDYWNNSKSSKKSQKPYPFSLRLSIGRDRLKDQSYFLAYLSQEQLKRCLFPLGGLQMVGLLGWDKIIPILTNDKHLYSKQNKELASVFTNNSFIETIKLKSKNLFSLPAAIDFDTVWQNGFTKTEVRLLARYFNLSNQNRKDSQGVCFLGKINFADFIRYHLGKQTGVIIEWETGEQLGEHEGYWYYTIGQRQGLCLSGGPWYVVKKDCQKNIVFISKRDPKCFDNTHFNNLVVSDINWFCEPKNEFNCSVKVRHGENLMLAKVELQNHNTCKVKFKEPDFGTATGQFAVFYHHDTCLGAGIIHI